MELKALIKLVKKNQKTFYLWMLAGALLASVIYYLPDKYISTGSFYIRRVADVNATFFTYEGYYAQQTALSYTNTVVGLLESVDLQSEALKSLGVPVNEVTLRKYARDIKAKKAAPQLVTLTVKGKSYDGAKNLWESLSKELISTAQEVNRNGDTKLSISKITQEPVVKKAYKSLWVYIPAGILLAAAAGIFFISLKEYD